MTVRVLEGHVLDALRSLPSNTFQCVATSPPYYGLRDYGLPPQAWGGERHEHEWGGLMAGDNRGGSGTFNGRNGHGEGYGRDAARGQFCACGGWLGSLGLEPTPELYVEHLVSVFREVRRVLRPDGCIFVNLGDSMGGSGKGPTGRSGIGDQATRQGFVGGQSKDGSSYDRSGKGPRGYRDRDSSSTSLCDGCRAAFEHRTLRTDSRPVLGSISCADGPSQARSRSRCPSPDSSDSATQQHGSPADLATLDQLHAQDLSGGPLHVSQASMTPESSLRLRAECSHCANCGACLSVLGSLTRDAQLCARTADGTSDTSSRVGSLAGHSPGTEPSSTAWGIHPLYPPAKPKDLLGMPWAVAFALRADGWYLRAEIIWSKPNPMPESVADRPTKAHETVFLLSKQRTYFYDADAIREKAVVPFDAAYVSPRKDWRDIGGRRAREVSGRLESGTVQNTAPQAPEAGRNKRSVWEIATVPFPGSHFAVFPPKLVEPMLLAGSRPGDHVLDPFGGAGTTGLVADRLGRDCTLIELNPEYAQMARERITGDSPLFAEVVA